MARQQADSQGTNNTDILMIGMMNWLHKDYYDHCLFLYILHHRGFGTGAFHSYKISLVISDIKVKVVGVHNTQPQQHTGLVLAQGCEMKGTHSFAKLCVHHEVVDMLLSLGQL